MEPLVVLASRVAAIELKKSHAPSLQLEALESLPDNILINVLVEWLGLSITPATFTRTEVSKGNGTAHVTDTWHCSAVSRLSFLCACVNCLLACAVKETSLQGTTTVYYSARQKGGTVATFDNQTCIALCEFLASAEVICDPI